MRKVVITVIFSILSCALYSEGSDGYFCRIEGRVNNYLLALTESINYKGDVAGYYHPQSFFIAPKERLIWLVDDYKIKTIRQADINVNGYHLYDLSSENIFDVEVLFHVAYEIKSGIRSEVNRDEVICLTLGELNGQYYILDVEYTTLEIFRIDKYEEYLEERDN